MQSRPARRHASAPARSSVRRGLVATASLLLAGGAVAVPVALSSSASAAAAWKHCPPGQSVVLVFQKSGGSAVPVYGDGVTPKPGDKATIVDKETWTWSTPQRTIASVLVDTGYGPNWVPKGPSAHGGTVNTPGQTIVAITLCGKDTSSTTTAPPTSPSSPTKTPTTAPPTTAPPTTAPPTTAPPTTAPPTTPPTSCEPSAPGGGGGETCGPTDTPSCEPSSPGGGGGETCEPSTPPTTDTPTPTLTGGSTTPTATPTETGGGTTTPSASTSTTPAGGNSGGGPSTWAGTTLPKTGSPSSGILTGGLLALVGGAALLAVSAWRRPARGAHRR